MVAANEEFEKQANRGVEFKRREASAEWHVR